MLNKIANWFIKNCVTMEEKTPQPKEEILLKRKLRIRIVIYESPRREEWTVQTE